MELRVRKNSYKAVENLSLINVFILAGAQEHKLSPICEDIPKTLVNIIGKPILAYQLEFLERNKFKEVTVVSNKSFSHQLQRFINETYQGSIKVDFVWIQKEISGTAEILPMIQKKITRENFMIISGDTIFNFDINNFIDNHIYNHNFISMAFSKEDQRDLALKLSNSSTYEIKVYGLSQHSEGKKLSNYKKVVFATSVFEKEDNKILLKKKLLKNVKRFELYSDYEDLHMYIFNKRVFNVINEEKIKHLCSIKNDLIPFLINHHYHDRLKNLFYFGKNENIDNEKLKNLEIVGYIIENPHYAHRINNLKKLFFVLTEITKVFEEIPKIYLYTKNNKPNIFLKVKEKFLFNTENDKPYFTDLPEYYKSISTDSYVCQDVKEVSSVKTKISKSICGSNLVLGQNSKVVFCIVFDNVVVGKDCNIENSIIGCDVIIEDNCNISGCVIQDGFKVLKGSKLSKETKKKSEDNEIEYS